MISGSTLTFLTILSLLHLCNFHLRQFLLPADLPSMLGVCVCPPVSQITYGTFIYSTHSWPLILLPFSFFCSSLPLFVLLPFLLHPISLFIARSHCVAQADLKLLTLCLHPLSAEITGVHHCNGQSTPSSLLC